MNLFESQQALLLDEKMINYFNESLNEIFDSSQGKEYIDPNLFVISVNPDNSSKDEYLKTFCKILELSPSFEERASLFKNIGIEMTMQNFSPVMLIFSSEVWSCSYTSDEEEEEAYKKYGNSLANHPSAKEGLMCSAMTLDGRSMFKILNVERDLSGKILLKEKVPLELHEVYNPLTSEKDKKIKNSLLSSYFKGVSLATALIMTLEGKKVVTEEEMKLVLAQMPKHIIDSLY